MLYMSSGGFKYLNIVQSQGKVMFRVSSSYQTIFKVLVIIFGPISSGRAFHWPLSFLILVLSVISYLPFREGCTGLIGISLMTNGAVYLSIVHW